MKAERATVFDKIGASVALDATAGRVTARGEHYVPDAPLPPGMMHWKAPPPIRIYDGVGDDYTGKKFGRFTAIGIIREDDKGPNTRRRWLCKCTCGDYEARSAKAVKVAIAGVSDPNGMGYRCYYCWRWEVTKGRYKTRGAKPLSAFIDAKAKVVEASNPDEIIADAIGKQFEGDHSALATDIIRTLNRSGYRIAKERHREPVGVMDEPTRKAEQA